MFLEWENSSGKLQIISGKFQNNAINKVKQISLSHVVSTSNHMFERVILDKLPECISENFEIARLKQGQFQNFQKSRGCFIPNIARTKHVING